jgi:hypothetical protein
VCGGIGFIFIDIADADIAAKGKSDKFLFC